MKHWKPFKTGGLYTCTDCDVSIEQQKEIETLKDRLSSALKALNTLEESSKKKQDDLA